MCKLPKVPAGFPEFWDTAYAKHQVHFDASAALQPLVNRIKQYAASETLHKMMRRITLVAANSYGALITLVLNGYGNDAMKIARSIFEADLTVGYLLKHRDELADYMDYHWIQQKELYDYMLKHNPEQARAVDRATVEELLRKRTDVAPRFKKYRGTWCRRSIRQMAEDLDEGMDQLYVTFYRWSSSMHHVSIGGLASQFEDETLDVDLAPSDKWLEDAFVAGFGSILRLVIMSNREFKLGLDNDIDHVYDMYRQAIKPS